MSYTPSREERILCRLPWRPQMLLLPGKKAGHKSLCFPILGGITPVTAGMSAVPLHPMVV